MAQEVTPFGGIEEDTEIVVPKSVVKRGSGSLESGVYDCTIDMAYTDVTENGSTAVHLVFLTDDGYTFKNTQYITGGTKKGGNHFFINKQGNKQYLPGYHVVNTLCLLTVGKPLSKITGKLANIDVWDYDAQEEVSKEKMVLTELLTKRVSLAVLKVIEDKKKKEGNKYVLAGGTKESNDIEVVFRITDGKNFDEIAAKKPKATFKEEWAAEHTGKTKDISTGKAAADTSAQPDSPTEEIQFGV